MSEESIEALATVLGIQDGPPEAANDNATEPTVTDGPVPENDNAEDPEAPPVEAANDNAEPRKWTLDSIRATTEWTPELLTSAAEWMAAEERRNATIAARAAKMDRKARQRIGRLESERSSWSVTRDQMIADAQALRNGSPAQRLDALARVTGLSPDQVIEELTIGVADGGKGKRPAIDAETAARIERLERALQERDHQDTRSQQESAVRSQLAIGVRDLESFPSLAAVAAEIGHEETVTRLLGEMRRRADSGQVLTVGDMLALADRAQARSRPSKAAAPVTAPKPATQSQQGRPPRSAARTVPARLADAPSASRRAPTEEERVEKLASLLGL